MFGAIYYNRVIRKITVGFGSLFTNLTLVRYNYNNGTQTEVQRTLVPIVEGQKEKYIQALEGDPLNDNKIQIKLPILAYSLLGMTYDATRKGQTTLQNAATNSNGITSQYIPVPWNFNFEVYIYVRNIEDGTQIIEQILPYFTPDYSLILNVVPNMNIQQSIPFTLDNISYEVANEAPARTLDSRVVIWTLTFTAKGWLYGPNTSSNIIKEAIVNIYNIDPVSETDVSLVLNSNGIGDYLYNEIVYQGKSLETATATAIAQNWTNSTKILIVKNATGMFYTNEPLVGVQSGSTYNVINYQIIPQILESIDVTANTASADILGVNSLGGSIGLGYNIYSANVNDPLIYDVKKTYYNTSV